MVRRPSVATALALVAALFSVMCAQAQQSSQAAADSPPDPTTQINALILEREFGPAAERLRTLISAEPEDADTLRLRLARILILSDRAREALPVCQEVIDAGPDAPLWRKAHFLAADAHAALGDFAAAQRLIFGQVEHLLSPERKAELAQVYIDHADELFDPPNEDDPPDFARAGLFYQQALDLGLAEEPSRELRHRIGQCWVEQENWGQAAQIYRDLLEGSEESPLHPTILFELARAELRQGQRVEARHHFRRLLREHPDAPEIADANWLLPQTFGGVQPPTDVDLTLAVNSMRGFVEQFPDHEHAPEAALGVARAYQHRGRTAEAIAAVEEFLVRDWKQLTPNAHALGRALLRFWPELRTERDALNRLEIARISDPEIIELMRRHGGEREMPSELVPEARILLGDLQRSALDFDAARAAWNTFLREHPTSPRWTEIQRRIVDLDFDEARHRIDAEEWDAARMRMQAFLDAHPLDPRQPEGLQLLGAIEEEQENWEAALEVWSDLIDKHPDSEPARRALLRSAEIAERELNDVNRARELYRRARDRNIPQATQALTRLEAPELLIETERAFRPGDTPTLEVTLRNIEEVTCQAYAIDLETYFRAKHSLAGVAALDIALIDPDQTWTHEVEDYEEFRLFEQSIELPLEGAGAWAIRLATEDLEATSLMLVTDLALITKASRNQVLVFAQRWADPTPAEGVSVLLSDGSEVFAELTTGADGTATYEDPSADGATRKTPLRDLSSLRVFATDGSSSACTELGLGDVQHVEARQPRGFLWSAKPVYQPGQTAEVTGIVRTVEGGRYVFAEGDEWQVTVTDSRGKTLMVETVTLDQFGTFAIRAPLPPEMPLGQCSVSVTKPPAIAEDGSQRVSPVFTGNFLVDRYQVDQVQLTVDLERRALARGEPVVATVTVRRYTGEPVRGAALQLQLAGDVRHEGTTDDDGQFEIELPTDELTGEFHPLVVTLPTENLTVRENVHLSETSVTASVRTVRHVQLAEEPFEVSVHTEDLLGDAVAVDATLKVVRVTEEGGEVELSSRAISTDAETGDGAAQIAIERGGLHRLRIEGTDAEGRPFTAQASVTISDEDDDVRLRVLADRDTYHAGESATLTVVNRTEARLALATWETDRMLRHAVIELREGRSDWTFPLTTDDSPTITAALALIDDTELHDAEKTLKVENDLVVALETDPPVAEPGDEVTVRVTAHDAAGNPVAARLGLALVDRALLARHPDQTADIGAFFFGFERPHTVRTISSAGFEYTGTTRPIAESLLAEEERRELQRQIAGTEFGSSFAQVPASVGTPALSSRAPEWALSQSESSIVADRVAGQDMFYAGNAVLAFDQRDVAARSLGRLSEFEDRFDYDYDPARGTVSEGDVYRVRNGNPFAAAGGSGLERAPRRNFAELAFFDAAVTTDANGDATVTIPMPDNTTLWRLMARGATADTLVGEQESEITTRRDFYVSAQLPARFTEGDRLFIPVRVHNLTDDDREAEVTITVTGGGNSDANATRRTVTVPSENHAETLFELEVDTPGDLTIAIAAESDDFSDAVEHTIHASPWGEPVVASRGGVATGDQTINLSLPGVASLIDSSLTIELFPSWRDALLEPIAARGFGGPASVASRALVDAALLDHLAAAAERDDARYTVRRQSLQAAVTHLLGSQQGDGGWAWIGSGSSRIPATAQSLRALVGAQRHGVWVDAAAVDRAVQYLQSALRSVRDTDLATRAEVQHALAIGGRGDFTALQALYRERNRLDVRSLALVSLAFDAMSRPEIAGEIAAILAQRFTPVADNPVMICWTMTEPVIDGSVDNLEATALAVLALARTQGMTNQVEAGARFLSDRLAEPWRFSDRAAAATAAALSRYHTETAPDAQFVAIDVLIDGDLLREVRWLGDAEPVSITLAAGTFDPANVRIDYRVRGEGQFAHRATLSGFRPGLDAVDFRAQSANVEREFFQAERRHGGREVPRGRSVAEGDLNLPANNATTVALGDEIIVRTRFWRHNSRLVDGYLVFEEPLPMGAQVVPDSVSGNFAHSEVLPGMIRLHIAPEQRWSGNVTYRLRGVVPGQFRVLPARIENIYNPEQTARSNPGALRVLAAGEANPDSYTLSPDELFHLGLWLAEDGEHVAAIEHLTPLFDGFVLRPDNERQVAEQILESAIALHAEAVPAPGATSDQLIVRFFEVLRERHPNVILTWDQTLEVARAYQAIEEFERSWQVLLGAAEASFLRDAQVAGVLEAQGAHRAAIAHLDNLIATYPDLQPVQSALYALGGAIEVKAKDAAIRDALKDDGLTVAELHQMSLARLEQFLVDYPDNPRVPEALLSLATLWVELEHRDRAIALCALLERTHSGSASVADAVYLQAYAHFLEGEDETALALCHRLAEEDFPTPAGARTPSVNRPQAHYITAQIRHAQGDPAAAVEAYRRIESRFPDAAQAIEHFLRRDLGLPEITRHAVGEDATVALTTRNLDDVHVRVFKVDLMTLYLLRRNLDQIVDVDLAGITPSLDQTIAVGAADDYLDHETEVALGVEEPGAYLVVAAAENLSASGLVLVTGLEVEVQEDPVSGRVRANVTHGDGTPVAAAAVRVIGANNPTFTAGETDRRGVMVADGIRGAATVLVRSGDQFAFHRGVQALQPPAEQPPMPFQTSSEGLYTNLGAVNSVTLGSQRALLDEITQNKQEGVDLYRVQQ